jgi:nucleoside-diphosphate-sugar epimerase
MKIFLTGSSGFIGGVLLKRLSLINNLDVNASAHRFSYFNNTFGIDPPRFNIFDFDIVLHLAGQSNFYQTGSKELVQINELRFSNINFTLFLARLAAVSGVKRFLFLSSAKVNGACSEPGIALSETIKAPYLDPYGQSKLEAEEGLRQISAETGMEVVIIRPPLVYGPGVKANFAALMRAVKKGWPLPLGAVHNQRSLVALDNLVDFIITCINHPNAANQTFLVSDGQDLSTTELLQGMAKAAGVPSRLLPIPVWALQTAASVLGKGDVIQRLCGNLQVDISKARNLLGWTPPISVEEGLRRAMQSAP